MYVADGKGSLGKRVAKFIWGATKPPPGSHSCGLRIDINLLGLLRYLRGTYLTIYTRSPMNAGVNWGLHLPVYTALLKYHKEKFKQTCNNLLLPPSVLLHHVPVDGIP